jgi:AcrR family transcriptional regulator
MTAVRWGGVKSPIRRPCRSNMPVGKFDQRVFCGPSNGNWSFALPASSRVETTACAAATIRAVASAGLDAVAAGFPPRWADPDTAATTKPGRRSIESRRVVLVTGGIIGAIERACNLSVSRYTFLYPESVKPASSSATAATESAAGGADTSDRLIAAAERLFAAHGYTNVSVRAIAAAAGVNWSLVGYYFRGKEGLLSEVYRRHCSSLNAERLKLLGQARQRGLQLEQVIEAFVRPALAEIQTTVGETSFSRLRAILAAEDSTLLTQLVASNFDMSSRTFVAALRECLPDVPPDDVLWRFHFMLGTIYYSVASPQRIKTFSKGRCDPGNLEDTLQHLVPFLAAAFRAPVASGSKRRRTRRKRSR